MSTNSTIALEFADDTVQQVYCHWDGYLSNNGRILMENYSDPFKLRDLIDLGDLSVLGASIGEKHDFNDAGKNPVCTFYGRDRGEKKTQARKFRNFEMYSMEGQKEQYNYILRRDGRWYVDRGRGFEALLFEMIKE